MWRSTLKCFCYALLGSDHYKYIWPPFHQHLSFSFYQWPVLSKNNVKTTKKSRNSYNSCSVGVACVSSRNPIGLHKGTHIYYALRKARRRFLTSARSLLTEQETLPQDSPRSEVVNYSIFIFRPSTNYKTILFPYQCINIMATNKKNDNRRVKKRSQLLNLAHTHSTLLEWNLSWSDGVLKKLPYFSCFWSNKMKFSADTVAGYHW